METVTSSLTADGRTVTFKVEDYRGGGVPMDAECDALRRMYGEVGLTALARNLEAAPSIGRRMSAEELAVWAWRYPTVYQRVNEIAFIAFDGRINQQVRAWQDLAWPVPPHVLGLIQSVVDAREFSAVEIWTPELRRAPRIGPSPILVGWRHGRAYLLARWAEALEPYETLRAKALSWCGRRAMARRREFLSGSFMSPLLGSVAAIVLVCAALVAVRFAGSGHSGAPLAFLLLSLPTLPLAVAAWWLRAEGPALRLAARWAGWVITP